jgi:hypothetical protein
MLAQQQAAYESEVAEVEAYNADLEDNAAREHQQLAAEIEARNSAKVRLAMHMRSWLFVHWTQVRLAIRSRLYAVRRDAGPGGASRLSMH